MSSKAQAKESESMSGTKAPPQVFFRFQNQLRWHRGHSLRIPPLLRIFVMRIEGGIFVLRIQPSQVLYFKKYEHTKHLCMHEVQHSNVWRGE